MENKIKILLSDEYKNHIHELSQGDDGLALCSDIVEASRLNSVHKYIISILKQQGFNFGIHNDSKELIAYLVFIMFAVPEGVFLVHRLHKKELLIVDNKRLDELLINTNDAPLVISNALLQTKNIFASKDELKEILQRPYIDKDGYKNLINKIKETVDLADCFRVSSFAGKIRDGKPSFVEIVAHTVDLDINKRHDIMGNNSKIESNIGKDGKLKAIKLSKRYDLL